MSDVVFWRRSFAQFLLADLIVEHFVCTSVADGSDCVVAVVISLLCALSVAATWKIAFGV